MCKLNQIYSLSLFFSICLKFGFQLCIVYCRNMIQQILATTTKYNKMWDWYYHISFDFSCTNILSSSCFHLVLHYCRNHNRTETYCSVFLIVAQCHNHRSGNNFSVMMWFYFSLTYNDYPLQMIMIRILNKMQEIQIQRPQNAEIMPKPSHGKEILELKHTHRY